MSVDRISLSHAQAADLRGWNPLAVLHQVLALLRPAAAGLRGAAEGLDESRTVVRDRGAELRLLRSLQAELNRTAEQLLDAQEEERRRIAVELHDSTTQHLVALGLGVRRLKRLLGERGGADDVLTDMSCSLHEAIHEIRVLSYLMRAPALQLDGLKSTAQRFVAGFGLRTGLTTTFRAEGRIDAASAAAQHAAFRIVQEALANVYRHAGARRAEVEISNRAGLLFVIVRDDGKGIRTIGETGSAAAALGVGIPGMRERAIQLGGELTILGGRRGTTVTAQFPLRAGETAAEGRD